MRITLALFGLLALNVGVAASRPPAPTQRPPTPPLVIASLSGADLFQFYCSSCHGRGGKGDGPVAASLKRPPPDLMTIAARHDGHFPSDEIRRYVAGDDDRRGAHGSPEMPVWGPIFYSLEPKDRLTRIRLENLVRYIETLQKPGTQR